jgi:hypothetical protein
MKKYILISILSFVFTNLTAQDTSKTKTKKPIPTKNQTTSQDSITVIKLEASESQFRNLILLLNYLPQTQAPINAVIDLQSIVNAAKGEKIKK